MSKIGKCVGFKKVKEANLHEITGRAIVSATGHFSQDVLDHSNIDIEQHIKNNIIDQIDTMVYDDVRYHSRKLVETIMDLGNYLNPNNSRQGQIILDKCLNHLKDLEESTYTGENIG